MMVCPEESLDASELQDLNYKYVFMGHDHQHYDPISLGNTLLFRPGSLTRHTVDWYNKDRQVMYYQLDTEIGSVKPVDIRMQPSSEVYLKGSFDVNKEATNKRPRTDMQSLSKLLARFDRKQVSNLSLEGVMKQLNGTEEQILYIRELHRLHNIKYS